MAGFVIWKCGDYGDYDLVEFQMPNVPSQHRVSEEVSQSSMFLAPTRWSAWISWHPRHGDKLNIKAIKGHRTSGLVVDEEVAWTCTMSCKRARKRVCVHSIFHGQAAETWWTWHQQTSEKNSTSSSTSVLGLRCYHNYSCCPSYTKANHRPHLFLHRARQEPSKPNAQRDSTFGSTFSMPMPKSAGSHSQGWLLPWVKCKSC